MNIHDQIKRGRDLCEAATKGPWSHTHIFAGEEIISAGFDGQTYVGTIFEQVDGEFIEHHNPKQMKQIYDLLDKAVEVIKFYGELTNYHTHYSQIVTPSSDASMIIRDDLQEVNAKDGSYKKMIGGKRAREFLAGLDKTNE
jgi:hypothetical protein